MKKNKNIIGLLIIVVVSIIGCAYALDWHKVYKENKLNTPIISNYIHEIKNDEFNNYLSDNPYAIIYFGISSDTNCREFEAKFKDFILANNLKESIVYLNVSTLDDSNFANNFDQKYNTDALRKKHQYLYKVPAVAIYTHTTLVNFVSDNNLTINNVKTLLAKYSFISQ